MGMDAHKKDLFIAMLIGTQAPPVTWTVPNEPNAVRRLVRKLEREAPGPVRVCYEAGPCGYALQRQATTARVSCQVIAPALIPRKPGERVKTNRRDARKLAELLRAGLLTDVRPPTPEEEAVRDLCRARDDAREDLQRCRHRLGKLLLRRGLHYPRAQLDARAPAMGRQSRVDATPRSARSWTTISWRLISSRPGSTELDARLAEIARDGARIGNRVGWLRCFRGIDTLTAMLILAELHDFRRFPSPRALMAYLGLVPGEDSSGEKHRRGRITKAGNALVRRLLVETSVALSTPARGRCRADATTHRAAGPSGRDCGQGAAAAVSALPAIGGRA